MRKGKQIPFLLFLFSILITFLIGNFSFEEYKVRQSGKIADQKKDKEKKEGKEKKEKDQKEIIKKPAKKALLSFNTINFIKGFDFYNTFKFLDYSTFYLEFVPSFQSKFRKVLYTCIIPKKAP